MQIANKILKAATMKPITTLVLPVDKFSSWIFEQNKKFSSGTKFKEGKFRGKNVTSTVEFEFKGGLLEPIDKVLLLALITEKTNGNDVISAQRLFKTLGGSNHLSATFKERLLNSVRKLATTYIKINMTEIVNLCYKGNKTIIEGNLVHCNIITAEINHKISDSAIEILDSPLLKVAEIKRQIAHVPIYFLSKINCNENLIILNWYLLERIVKIVGSHSSSKKRVRKLNTTILLETLCQKCGFVGLDKYDLRRLRDNIRKILEHFVKIGLILEYKFLKINGKNHSIEISLNGVSISTEENKI